MSRQRVVVEADGGARGNPGPAGYGAVVRDAETGQVLAERSEAIGVTTNNVAEYRGLIAGLQAATELGATEVEVRMDSKLVVEQMSGRWQIKHPGLRPLAAQAAGLTRRFDSVSYRWVPRDRNRHADALANAAMDAAERKPAPSQAVPGRAVPGQAAPGRVAPDTTDLAAGRTSWEPRPANTATRLVLVRHGETELTAQRRYSGRGDVPLSMTGVAQAHAIAARVAALVPSAAAVLSSPLSRCTATAETIAAALGGRPVQIEPDLVECDFGEWEGRTFAEVKAGWPTELEAWLADQRVAPPGGESLKEVAVRVQRALAALLAKYPAEPVVLVSHVTPLKILLRDALAAGDAFLQRLYLDPAGMSIIDYWPDGGVAVRLVNETAGLR